MVLTIDKAGDLVTMDKGMYIEKWKALLNDKETYKGCRDQIKSIHSKVVKQLLNVTISTGHQLKKQYNKLHTPGNNRPHCKILYLPKIHKANIPFRSKL